MSDPHIQMSIKHLTDYQEKIDIARNMTFMGLPLAEMDQQDLMYVAAQLEEMRQSAADSLSISRRSVFEMMRSISTIRPSYPKPKPIIS